MLPGLLWEARQLVIEFNTSPFSPQLPVQGPSFKLFLVTFCLVILFLYLIRAAPVQLQLCCRLYLILGRQTQALTPRVALQGPSDLSLSAGATPAMEGRDTDAMTRCWVTADASASLQVEHWPTCFSTTLRLWCRLQPHCLKWHHPTLDVSSGSAARFITYLLFLLCAAVNNSLFRRSGWKTWF